MNKYLTIIIFVFLTLTACAPRGEWQAVKIDSIMRTDSLHSEEAKYGNPLECRVRVQDDTLTVRLSDLNFAWPAAYIDLAIHDGMFRATLRRTSLDSLRFPATETVRQRLRLSKANYVPGDTLCAEFDLRFRLSAPEGERDWEKEWTENLDFRGTICEIVRDRDFDPFTAEHFMTFDLPTALHEMGKPLDTCSFNMMTFLPEFRVELLNYFPYGSDVRIEELEWDTSPTRGIDDEGKERLTVWYARLKDRHYFRETGYHSLPEIWNSALSDSLRWLPVHSMEWNTDMQF